MARAVLGDRTLFPDLDCAAYLAHAAIAPLSVPVVERVSEVVGAYAQGGLKGSRHCAPLLEHARQQLAGLVGASEDEVAFVSNTTHGVIDIAFGIGWEHKDAVLLFEGEFPANVTPWQQAAQDYGLELRWCSLAPFHRAPEEGLAALRRELAYGVRLVAVSAVQYKTGLRMPIEAMASLCREHGAELFVDAIQAVGATPIDVGCGIDYLSTGSHKHLMGPEGAGMVYVSAKHAERFHPRLAGWLSHEHATDFLSGEVPLLRHDKALLSSARVFEIGTVNAIGLSALGVSAALLSEIGVPAIHAHVNAYLDVLEEGLVGLGFSSLRSNVQDARSTLLSVAPPDGISPPRLARELARRGVVCNTPDGLIRFSPHWPNAVDEVPKVLEAVHEALAALRG
ncbi:MAG: aminotransferase class V-fold PLP-dependent enzyme [Myxococcota bacterium]